MEKQPVIDNSNAENTWDEDERDDLEALIAEIAQDNPEFPAMVEAAMQRRQAARARGEDPNAEPDEDEATETDQTQEHPATPHAKG